MSYKIILLIFFHLLATSFSFGQTKTTIEEQAMLEDSILVEKLLCANEWYACLWFDSIPQFDSVSLYNASNLDLENECSTQGCSYTNWEFDFEGYKILRLFYCSYSCPLSDSYWGLDESALNWAAFYWEYDKFNKLLFLRDYEENELKFILEIIHLSEEKLVFKVRKSF